MGDMLRYDAERLRILVERHQLYTGSAERGGMLDDWDDALQQFVKVDAARIPARAGASWRPRHRSRGVAASAESTMGKPTGFLEDRAQRPRATRRSRSG